VDVATESTNYAKYNILVQSGTAMLAQANSQPQSVLRLLQ
jgi:flagellin